MILLQPNNNGTERLDDHMQMELLANSQMQPLETVIAKPREDLRIETEEKRIEIEEQRIATETLCNAREGIIPHSKQ